MVGERQVFCVLEWGIFYGDIGQVCIMGALNVVSLDLSLRAMCGLQMVSSWKKTGQTYIFEAPLGAPRGWTERAKLEAGSLIRKLLT